MSESPVKRIKASVQEVRFSGARKPLTPESKEYNPGMKLVMCLSCGLPGTLAWPPGAFSFAQGDNIMSEEGKGKCWCPNPKCPSFRKFEAEYKAIEFDKVGPHELKLLRESQKDLLEGR